MGSRGCGAGNHAASRTSNGSAVKGRGVILLPHGFVVPGADSSGRGAPLGRVRGRGRRAGSPVGGDTIVPLFGGCSESMIMIHRVRSVPVTKSPQ